MNFDHMPYTELVDQLADWAMRNIDQLAGDGSPPLVVPLTVTFKPNAVHADRVLMEFERLYQRVCRLLVNNPGRASKRHLLPFVLAFRDDPSTRPDKHPSAADVFFNHPSAAPHVHSIMVVHPSLADRFREVAGELPAIWRNMPRRTGDPVRSALRSDSQPLGLPRFDNGSLHADLPFADRVRRLMDDDRVGNRALVRNEVRKVICYSAKLVRRRSAAVDGDLYTALPTETGSPLAGRPALAGRKNLGPELSTVV
jgi:hypothetical protein